MIKQPRIFGKVIHELNSVVGKDRLVQESDLPNLKYIKACVKEAFRLHPVAPFNVSHVTTADSSINGYFIPEGSHMTVHRLGLGRNQDVALTYQKLHMFSFSMGQRRCPGALLGSTMTTIFLASHTRIQMDVAI
ncbi:putative phenylalanine N-monooxygenase [Helianthus annuus]|nr:putative phenylalanine N-monooxygenase [Helianthus annuus]